MKISQVSHHGILSEEFDVFYYELLRIKELALRSSHETIAPVDNPEDEAKTITVSGPVLALQERFTTFFEKQRERLYRVAVGPSSLFIQEAQYIFVAMADEIMINQSWQGSDYWRQNCLETKIFQTQIAGERVFFQIDGLLKTNDPMQRELARLYLLSLSLGFQGKFRTQSNIQILSYKQQLFSFIYHRNPDITSGTRNYIFEDSLNYVFTEAPAKGLPDLKAWSATAIAVLLVYLFISYGVWMMISDDLHEVLQSIFHLSKQGPVV
ncbi:MAG: DotU family type IV/VI secretion system protein [Proteobacteria bacterium]|nr:DotU family type IV/VI secretion system protein [Pseudomonadota bacterium]